MYPVVFLGPSLDHKSASRELEAEYLPPIARGDIDSVMGRDEPPCAIGIVDGRFLSDLSVSPKEVLRAADAGIAVYGSSSMGALRAVECAPFGVVGVGRIYEAYASGEIEADDEVAIVYDPESLRALSTPMVDFRFALQAGVERNRIADDVAERFLDAAKAMHFPQRTTANVLSDLRAEIDEDAARGLAEYLGNEAPETKRDDAVRLLRTMRDDLGRSTGRHGPASAHMAHG
ncbi:TfuA-like protein [Nocardiopsis baichengensis]|uniref:TfuA-like protein n=1 Tax=Nocardiopsis baichengensis TaxID=280240 RepID=UPI00037AE01A|nr:TfuA-like protein [Nocardiopsis baichengensis]